MVSINELLPPAKTTGTAVTRWEPKGALSIQQRRAQLDLKRPSKRERDNHTKATKATIDELIRTRTEAPRPSSSPQVIQYTPAGGTVSRTLRIVDKQNDPLEPPRHRFQKEITTELADTTTKQPVLRQPVPLTDADRRAWDIPASVSNWKNSRGYMIDLEHRSAPPPERLQRTDETVEKQLDLASALAQAEDDVQAEGHQQAIREDEQRRLKQKLLHQKKSSQHDADSDLFDTRLYHSSSKRQGLYNEDLFSAAQTKRRYIPKASVEFEADGSS